MGSDRSVPGFLWNMSQVNSDVLFYWHLVGWRLPTVLNMLVDIPHWCPVVQNLVMNVSVDWCSGVCHHCINPACSEMCVVQTGVLFLSLSGSGRGDSSILQKLPVVLEEMVILVCLRVHTEQCLSAPK